MTTPKLYTATVNGITQVGRIGEQDIFWYLKELRFEYATKDEYTDLTEVTVVPKDAAVIEGFTVPYLADMADFAKAVMRGQGHHNSERDFKKLADQLTAQLSPSATTETEGGAGEPVCKDCGGIKYDENGRWCESDFHLPSVPTPTVTIELDSPQYWNLFLGVLDGKSKEKYLAKQTTEAQIAQDIASQIRSQLTPPRPEEPKGYTTLVRANEKGFIARPRWQKHIDTDLWNSSDGDINVKWSDLENPVILSEGTK